MRANNVTVGVIEPLVDVDEVVRYNEGDRELFNELQEILKKHGALRRFSVTLLHKHFDVANDEILLETTDREARTQVIRPVKKSEIDKLDYIETSWRLDT